MDKSVISGLRKTYTLNELLEQNVFKNPIEQFKVWFNEALEGDVKEPNAMVLSTVVRNKPSARIVLLKGVDENGFEFFTNYDSAKGKALAENNFASLTFFWDGLERQVRIEGIVEKLSAEASDNYYWSRPRESQIGAWVSNQSAEINKREELEQTLEYYQEKFKNVEIIPRPKHWGGYNLIPDKIEFWQGRPSRLHDRLLYAIENGEWKIKRLQP